MIKSEKLARILLPNLRALSDRIARKPPRLEPQWAKTVTESFTLYTRTSTINYLVSMTDILREYGWPFPSFIDLSREFQYLQADMRWVKYRIMYAFLSRRSTMIAIMNIGLTKVDEATKRRWIDALLCRRFKRSSKEVFKFWLSHPLLQSRGRLLRDIIAAYRYNLWGACAPSILPILDFVIRGYLGTDDLRTSVGNVSQAFKKAGIAYESLLPGYAVFNALKSDSVTMPLVSEIEKDLRLPGIFLAAFIDTAEQFYAWHTTAGASVPGKINRHAILHGDAEYWTKAETVKLLIFFDLALKLDPVLRIALADSEDNDSG